MSGSQPPRRVAAWTRRALWISLALGISLLLLDRLRLRHPDFHPHFAAERWFGFFAGLSALSCLLLAVVVGMVRAVAADTEDDRT
jgi:hypothetical protein